MNVIFCDDCRHEITPEMCYHTPVGGPHQYTIVSPEPPGQRVKVELRLLIWSGQDYCLPCLKRMVAEYAPRKYQ